MKRGRSALSSHDWLWTAKMIPMEYHKNLSLLVSSCALPVVSVIVLFVDCRKSRKMTFYFLSIQMFEASCGQSSFEYNWIVQFTLSVKILSGIFWCHGWL